MYFLLLFKNKIICKAMGESPSEEYIEVSKDEFEKSNSFYRFDVETREFSEPIIIEELVKVKTNEELEEEIKVLNQAITELSMIMASTIQGVDRNDI